MKTSIFFLCGSVLFLFFAANIGLGQKTMSAGKRSKIANLSNTVCSDPGKPCNHKQKRFDDWELSFKMPAKLATNKTYKSAAFYAVILETFETGEDCDGGKYDKTAEAERKKVQKKYSERKVFSNNQCPNLDSVDYDFEGKFVNDKLAVENFIAVYAGTTKAEAEKFLQTIKKNYPQGMLKRMVATYERMVQ